MLAERYQPREVISGAETMEDALSLSIATRATRVAVKGPMRSVWTMKEMRDHACTVAGPHGPFISATEPVPVRCHPLTGRSG